MDSTTKNKPSVKDSALAYTTGFVKSKDGTTIGYRQFGHGPGIMLVHGGMMASQNFTKLATALADEFTVYVPDRRGRGLSGPFGDDFGIHKQVEDMQAVLAKTSVQTIFGLSAGAIVSLQTVLVTPAIQKLAVYEPPFSLSQIPQSSPRTWLARYDREMAQGKLADAMVTAAKGIKDAPVFSRLPRFITATLMKLAIPAEAQEIKGDDVPLKNLIPTMHFDAQIVLDTEDKLEAIKNISAEVLLLGGSKSPRYLKQILDAVAVVLPNARRVELAGLGHMAADNGGKPGRIAEELRRFFSEPQKA